MRIPRRRAFTLLEMVVVLTVIVILVGLGIWTTGLLRQDAQTVASADLLAAVQRMQQLSDMNGLTQTNTDPVLRLVELQADLAGAGYANFNLNPQTAGSQLSFSFDSSGSTRWQNATP